MVLTLETIAKEVAVNVGDRNKERLPEIRRYVKQVVTELSAMLRDGAVYETAQVTVSSNQGLLPTACAAVLRVYDSGSTTYEVVGNAEYRTREQGQSTLPTCQVLEAVPNWTVRFLNFSTGNNTVNVDYLISSDNPATFPEYYKHLIVTGAEAKYHLRRSPRERFQDINSEYKQLKNMFQEQQSYNEGKTFSHMKGFHELERSDPANSLFARSDNDYMSSGW